jgi:hypothetical protein
MLRLGLRLAVSLLGLWLLPIMLIRAQPYNDGGLRDFLINGDCAAPCFLNIYPGVTTMREADAIIQNQQWVDEALRSPDSGQPGAVFWTWNGQQPPFFSDIGRGSIRSFNGERVSEVLVEIGVTFGEIWLSLGPPDAYAVTIQGTNFPDISVAFITLYPGFAILGSIDCPYHTTLWRSNVMLRLRREQSFPGPFLADTQPMAWRVMQMEKGWCG